MSEKNSKFGCSPRIFSSCSNGQNSDPNPRVVSWCYERNLPTLSPLFLRSSVLWRTASLDRSNTTGGDLGVGASTAAISIMACISHARGVNASSGPGTRQVLTHVFSDPALALGFPPPSESWWFCCCVPSPRNELGKNSLGITLTSYPVMALLIAFFWGFTRHLLAFPICQQSFGILNRGDKQI
jgi:hypothetical protein